MVVLILCAFLKGIKRPKNIAEILEKAIEEWGDKNAPLIFKAEEYPAEKKKPYAQGYVLLQDPKKYVPLVNAGLAKDSAEWHKYALYSPQNHSTGDFIDMPSYDMMTQNDFDVLITMAQSHFSKMTDIDKSIDHIAIAANYHCRNRITATKKSLTIQLHCKKINTKDDVNAFVDELDFILSLVKVIA